MADASEGIFDDGKPEEGPEPVQAEAPAASSGKQTDAEHPKASNGNLVRELERMMTGLVSMKEKKLTQIEADKAALKEVEAEIAMMQPKIDQLDEGLKEKTRRRDVMQVRLNEQMAQIMDLSGATSNLIAKARASNRRLDRSMATSVTTDARGYNTSDSIKTIRSGKKAAADTTKPATSSSSRSDRFAFT